MLTDLRFALRLWKKTPSLVVMAVVALGLGVGATTAVFSVVRAVLLRPLPYRAPHELVMVWEKNIPRNREKNVVSPGNFIHWGERSRVFDGLAALTMSARMNLTRAGEPRELPAQFVSGHLFQVLGVNASRGRTFLAAEDHPRPTTAVISDRLWQRALGGDPNVVGRALALSGRSYTVVGVMPPGFTILDPTVDVWIPLGLEAGARTPRGRGIYVVGRLKPGVTSAQAQADMTSVSASLVRDFPAFNTGWTVNVIQLQEDLVGKSRPALLVLFAAIALVLLIACANVANLLLAQSSARQRELAVRTALGAGRWRLVRQLLVESSALAAVGGLAGAALAWTGVRLLTSLPLERLPVPRLTEVAIDVPVALFAIAVALGTGLLFGVAPALTASAVDLQSTLKEGSRGVGVLRGARTRALLVTVEVALSMVLLVGAGLLIRSFLRLTEVPLGFESEHVLTAQVSLPSATYQEKHQRVAFFETLVDDVRTLPGVASAGAINFLPLKGLASATRFWAGDKPKPEIGQEPVTDVRVVSGDYFQALGIPLTRGRLFNAGDSRDGVHVLVINETMARQIWPGENPLGKQLHINWDDPNVGETIIGVVGDIKHYGADSVVRPMIYWPYARFGYTGMSVVMRTSGDPVALASSLVSRVRARDRDLPVSTVETMEQVVSAAVRERRLIMTLLGVFAVLALVLAAVGIYSVMSYTVGQRTHEIGVRIAIGADRRDVMRLVLRQTLWLASTGLIVGVLAALALTRLMRTLLFEVEPTDPVTLAVVFVVLIGVATLAGYVPGRRASRVDPIVALRYE
jgi:putative ABC transport system permease protein